MDIYMPEVLGDQKEQMSRSFVEKGTGSFDELKNAPVYQAIVDNYRSNFGKEPTSFFMPEGKVDAEMARMANFAVTTIADYGNRGRKFYKGAYRQVTKVS